MAQLRRYRNNGVEALPWSTLQDTSISFTARGLLAYCLSMPDDWDFCADRIAAQGKDFEGTEGVTAIRKAFAELEEAGYRRLVTEQDAGGKWRSYAEFAYQPVEEWVTEYRNRAEKAKARKKPGPKKLSAAARTAAAAAAEKGRAAKAKKKGRATNQQEETFPQVAPEVLIPKVGESDSGEPGKTDVSAGRTGSAYTEGRSEQFLRVTSTQRGTHTPQAPPVTETPVGDDQGVCVDVDETTVEDVTNRVVKTVPAKPRATLSRQERRDIAEVVRGCLARGHLGVTVERRVRGRTNDGTHSPAAVLLKALRALESESSAAPRVSGATRASRSSAGVSGAQCPECFGAIEYAGAACSACASEALAAKGAVK